MNSSRLCPVLLESSQPTHRPSSMPLVQLSKPVQHSLLQEEYLKTLLPSGMASLVPTQTPLRGAVCSAAVTTILSKSVLLQPNISREVKSCMMNIRSLRFPMADILLCTSVDETCANE